MKIVEQITILDTGKFSKSAEWQAISKTVVEAVNCIDWPHGSGQFTILTEKHGNGVVPIKKPCIERLARAGWMSEALPKVPKSVLAPGDLDALYDSEQGYVGFEWETGNISSSHRAVNKLLWSLSQKVLIGAFLVLPSNKLYPYLTDRIGNINELRPYFPLWQSYNIKEGVFKVIVAEHDTVTNDERFRIPKGKDGNAFRWKGDQ